MTNYPTVFVHGFYGWGDIFAAVKAGEEADGSVFYPFIFEGAVVERYVTGTPIVTGDANARSNPSLNGYKLGVVTQGSWLTYRNVYSVDDRGVMWYGITFDGEDAWISSRYSYVLYDEEEDETYDDYPVVFVHRDSHVRDYPSLDGESLTVARAGTVLRADGESRWDNRGVEWYYVCCNGYWGWISSRYTSAAG